MDVIPFTIFVDSLYQHHLKTGAFSFVILNDSGIKASEEVHELKDTSFNLIELRSIVSVLERCKQLTNENIVIKCKSFRICDRLNRNLDNSKLPYHELWDKIKSLSTPKITFQYINENSNNEWISYTRSLSIGKCTNVKR